jgi:hypothetical protein
MSRKLDGPTRKSCFVLAALAVFYVLSSSCSKDPKDDNDNDINDAGGSDADTDTDTDADSDTDTDTDTDTDADSGADSDADGGADGGSDTDTDGATRILFVGNSYTYVNDLPNRVVAIAESMGFEPAVEVSTIAVGGAWLQDHADNPATMAEIEGGGWDFVVLQEQSYLPIIYPETFYAAAGTLATAALDGGAAPALFETWARAEGNELYSGDLAGYTPETMQAALRDAYTEASELTGAAYLPVGDTWELALAAYPEMPLFGADGSHPSEHGTYLGACVIFAALTGASLDGAGGAPDGVSEEDAAILRGLAASLL